MAEGEAKRRADALAPRLARLVVQVPREADVATLKVERDDVLVDRALYGISVAVDPGVHEIKASAAGRQAWKTLVKFTREGQIQEVVVPVLSPAEETRPPAPPSVAPTTTSRGRRQRPIAFVVGGAGLAALAVGTVYGLKARSSWSDVTTGCTEVGSHYECSATGQKADEDARSSAEVATVMFAVGGAAVVTGAVLYLIAPKQTSELVPIRVAPMRGGAAMTLTRSF